ncbi:MAG: hypothetical protein Q8L36_02235 [bacterium]|nr:hypothetical protein [bacterium]
MIISRKAIFLIFLGLAILFIRFSGLLSFPIFNDEGIYLQYSQLMSGDFPNFKFISVDNVFHDWKPPLQYWLGSVVIDWFTNPLLAGRALSAFFWVIGLIGVYFLGFWLWGRREGFWAAIFYLLNSPTFFYGGQFVAEVYVWTAAVWLFACSVFLMKRSAADLGFWVMVGGIIAGTSVLLFKQASFLYFYLAWLLPFFFWPAREKKDVKEKKSLNLQIIKKRLWQRNAFTVFTILALSFLFYKLVIPANLFALEGQYTGRWTFGLNEIFSWPIESWLANLKIVWNFYLHYYSPVVIFLAALFTIRAFWQKKKEEIFIGTMFWLASAAVVFGLRSFNEYLYHTAVIVFLAVCLGRLWEDFRLSWLIGIGREKIIAGLLLAAMTFVLLFGSWQIYLIKTNQSGYLNRGTTWAKNNYLISWANGFNVLTLIKSLEALPDPSIAFIDPQWGNPGTALQVFQYRYPQVKLAPISFDLMKSEFVDQIKSGGFKERLIIYSALGNLQDVRKQWQEEIEKNLCNRKEELRAFSGQTPVVVCHF